MQSHFTFVSYNDIKINALEIICELATDRSITKILNSQNNSALQHVLLL